MIKLKLEWFKNHDNCKDKGKLSAGFITNEITKELGFIHTNDFINYVNREYHLFGFFWYELTEEGLWVYSDDILYEIKSEYLQFLYS